MEPERPIVDAHHHIWPEAPVAGYEAYGVKELLFDKTERGHRIVAAMCVDSHITGPRDDPPHLRPVAKTRYVEQIAQTCLRAGGKEAGTCSGIVPPADLLLGGRVETLLQAHREASPARFCGIRHMTVFDPDYPTNLGTKAGMLGMPAFREGFACLAKNGSSFDAWAVHPQLQEIVDLARSFPDSGIVVNHLGGPIGIGRFAGQAAGRF